MQDNQFHNFIFFILARIGQNQNIDGNYKLSFVSFFSLYNLVFSSSLVWIYLSYLHCTLFHFSQCKQSFYRQSKICQLGGIFRLFRITWKYATWGIIFFLPLCRAYIQEHFDTKFDLGNCMQSKFLIGNAIFFFRNMVEKYFQSDGHFHFSHFPVVFLHDVFYHYATMYPLIFPIQLYIYFHLLTWFFIIFHAMTYDFLVNGTYLVL